MKKYSVSIPWHATVTVEVEAENKAVAEAKALVNAEAHVCVACSREITIGEYDSGESIEVMEIDGA